MHTVRRRSRGEIAHSLMQTLAEHGPASRKSIDKVGEGAGPVPTRASGDHRRELDQFLDRRPGLHGENVLGGAIFIEAAAGQSQD